MADEGCSSDYFTQLKQAETNPPYLPFLGAFLKNVISLFTIIDEGGMRTQHKKIHHDHIDVGVRDDHECPSTLTGSCYHSDGDTEDSSADDDVQFADFFKKVCTLT